MSESRFSRPAAAPLHGRHEIVQRQRLRHHADAARLERHDGGGLVRARRQHEDAAVGAELPHPAHAGSHVRSLRRGGEPLIEQDHVGGPALQETLQRVEAGRDPGDGQIGGTVQRETQALGHHLLRVGKQQQ